MIRRKFVVAAALVALVLLSSCSRVRPVYNVEGAQISTATGVTLTLEQVRQDIVDAAERRRWVVRVIGEGHLVAILHVRSHMAQVDIRYSPTSYSITYRDSAVLLYDGGMIHRKYNSWVVRLERDINKNLTSH